MLNGLQSFIATVDGKRYFHERRPMDYRGWGPSDFREICEYAALILAGPSWAGLVKLHLIEGDGENMAIRYLGEFQCGQNPQFNWAGNRFDIWS